MEAMIKVLLVDDEFFVLDQIRQCISWEKFGVELIGCCGNAVEALEAMIDETPDILITDIKMPLMNGLELIDKVKQMNPFVECVVLSGYGEFSLAKAAMDQGVFSYLLKPFSELEFEEMLHKCCAQILKRRTERNIQYEHRTEIVSELARELQTLKDHSETIDASQIRALMKLYSDLSLLREAGLFLLSGYSGNETEKNRYLSEFFNVEINIYESVAALLNKMHANINESELVRKIKDYTRQYYYQEDLNLQWIAENVVHLGVKYVGRCFISETGVKYSEYLSDTRMKKAKELLSHNREMRGEEIANQVGLGRNIPYFYQVFKKYTGMTPKEYREVCRG